MVVVASCNRTGVSPASSTSQSRLQTFSFVVKFDYILEDKPMPVANYLEAGSELKIKVDLAYPLNATEEEKKTDESIEEEMVRRQREKTRWKLFH